MSPSSPTDNPQGPCGCGLQCAAGACAEKWVEGCTVWTNRGRADSSPAVLGQVGG